ncbi:MAG: hypothetical protein ACREBU_00560 [Nitrososphaera sp.]
MITPPDLLKWVIEPTLRAMGARFSSSRAARLLAYTSIAESTVSGHTRLHQVRGPALGIFQVEPFTAQDLITRYRSVLQQFITASPDDVVSGNLYLSTALARCKYYDATPPLPRAFLVDIGAYWKKHYNTDAGRGTVDGFVSRCMSWTIEVETALERLYNKID